MQICITCGLIQINMKGNSKTYLCNCLSFLHFSTWLCPYCVSQTLEYISNEYALLEGRKGLGPSWFEPGGRGKCASLDPLCPKPLKLFWCDVQDLCLQLHSSMYKLTRLVSSLYQGLHVNFLHHILASVKESYKGSIESNWVLIVLILRV